MNKLIFTFLILVNLSAFSQNTAKDYFYQGEIKSGYFDAEGAIADYQKAIELDANYIEAYYKIGIIYYDKRMFDEAVSYFDKAIAIDQLHKNSFYLRARSKFELKKYAEAIEDYNQAFENKKDTKVYYGRALAKYFAEDYKGAVEDFDQTVKYKFKASKKVDSSDAYFYRALSKQKLGNETEACDDLKKAKEFGSTKSDEELKIKCK
ncbi:MAG TPA: hypothetical protein DDX39_03865 [Bacteroidales bacterium]|nr:MAG: hypothetical protein A2W98_09025 [Bacteroidetes bacterium GWF2_33_38]OFY88768.1 MAG: hypothetical protein A2236_03750 [Bacteroidetes bacterium RIFOXYA2_FULL_33_7]HBF87758.1 hypothetical protein [Bacteroidales bacterium]